MSISLILLLPVAGALGLVLMRPDEAKVCRATAFFVSLIAFLMALRLLFQFDPAEPGMQFVEEYEWIPTLRIRYAVGLDGISLFLFLLTAFLTPVAILGSFRHIERREREFYACMLLLEAGMLGTFAATDLFLFYVFWEAALIPMYLVIGIWGGRDRVLATTQFVIYTMLGSVLMLVAIICVYLHAPQPTFDIRSLISASRGWTASEETWLFLAFALAFAIKLPLFPFHTWLPAAHVEAPAAGSVLLAGVLLKMGGYGMIRLAIPLFPRAALGMMGVLAVLAVIGVIYGALMSLAQNDFKKLIAYSSVSHLGTCMLGLASLNLIGIQGFLFLMLSHGVTTGGLFLLAGMLYERTHTREMEAYGGMAAHMPVFAVAFVLVALGSMGVPLTSGFVGEFLALQGAFLWSRKLAVLAGIGVILSAVYILWMIHRIFYGKCLRADGPRLGDATARETAVLAPVVVLTLILGIFPSFFLDRMEPSLRLWMQNFAAVWKTDEGGGHALREPPALRPGTGRTDVRNAAAP